MNTHNISETVLQKLSKHAWKTREHASIIGNTKVGAALITSQDNIYSGCNVEQVFRSHDIHAEVNAIGNMISGGEYKFLGILIVAERNRFTPCGACMDWIMQYGGENALVGFQPSPKDEISIFKASDLMPHYPK